MQFNNEKTRNVAEIAAKIMYGEQPVSEELKGGQKKLDKNHNNKIDGQDFAILRGEKKTNEEVEQIDEISKNLLRSYLKGVKRENDPRIHGDSAGPANQMSSKARSLGRTEQDKEDSRYEGQRLAKRKLGAPGSIPARVMAK